MRLENSVSEQDTEATSRQFVQRFGNDSGDHEPDLSVDGLSDSLFSRLLGLFRGRMP